ncbi:MAG: hypothetical protein KDA59_26680, partial [Planctomycetales bacterium]|nr:hypothetical protein [Planctomycetales bacterium]
GHSTGGLVTRAYIQSDAYNEKYEGNKRLPAINRFIMLDVPNQGASKPWNPLHDDWGFDTSYKALSKFPKMAFLKLAQGETIHGPEYDIKAGALPDTEQVKYVRAEVDADGNLSGDTVRFINLFIPTMRTLLATYEFLDRGDGTLTSVNADENDRNWLALDLNGGTDPNSFAGHVGQAVTVFGDEVDTATSVLEERCFVLYCPDRFSILDGARDSDRFTGETYWTDIKNRELPDGTTEYGDDTVPYVSLAGQFVNDSRVIMSRWVESGLFGGGNTSDGVKHTEIVANPDVQRAILEFLGNDPTGIEISEDSQTTYSTLGTLWTLISDPVEAILIDANGKRLGYSRATGVLTEIPNSVYVGEEDGIGFIFGSVATPVRLEVV